MVAEGTLIIDLFQMITYKVGGDLIVDLKILICTKQHLKFKTNSEKSLIH